MFVARWVGDRQERGCVGCIWLVLFRREVHSLAITPRWGYRDGVRMRVDFCWFVRLSFGVVGVAILQAE